MNRDAINRPNPMQVKDLTVDELKALIRETVEAALEDLLPDPDAGRPLKPELEKRLLDSLQQTESGEKGIPAEEVARLLA
jgi:hypothetical protein